MCVACSRRSDKGDGAKKREQEKKIGVRLGRDVKGTYSLPLPAFLSSVLHFEPLSGTTMEPRLKTTPFIRPPRYYDHILSTQT